MKPCTQPLWYHDRKNGKGRDCPLYIDKLRNKTAYEKVVFKTKSLGREYMSNDEVFQYLESLLSKVQTNLITGVQEARKAYMYIISKQISGQVYYKLGLSEKPNLSRIVGAQTFLIPGLDTDVGFQIHMIMTFPTENIGNSDQYVCFYVEKMCHKILRFYFKAANLKFGNDESSEWYLIPEAYGVYFCGFILDIVATFAYNSEDARKQLAPQNIWIFSEKKPIQELKLPPSREVLKRLRKDDRYNQVMDVFDHFGLRHIRDFANTLTVEIQPSDKIQAKGTKDVFEKELLGSDGEPVTYFLPSRDESFLLTKIIKNQYKFSVGQPLQTGEIYGIITLENRDIFRKQNIDLIPYTTDSTGVFVEFCIHIGDLLEIVKPVDSDLLESWPLKTHYEYYQKRKDSSTKKQFAISHNFVAPQWYFQVDVQRRFARKFIQGVIQSQKKQLKHEHRDTSLTDSTIIYTWTLTGQSILKEQPHEDETKNRIRSAYYVVRSRPQGNTTVTEEVPVVRLMHLWKVKESDLDAEVKTTRFPGHKQIKIREDLVLKENNHIRIPKGLLFQSLEDDEFDETVLVFLIRDIYSKRYDDNEEMVYVRGLIKFPFDEIPDDTLYVIMVKTIETHADKIALIEEPKLKKGQVIKAKPSVVDDFGEEDTKESQYHYAKIVDVQIDYDFMYRIQYFPPFDKVEPWAIPETNKEALKAGQHPNPKEKHLETWDRDILEGPNVSVVKLTNTLENKKEKTLFENYKKKLAKFKQPVARVLSHLPAKATTIEETKIYHVVFGNKSKGKIPASELSVELEDAYWGRSRSNSRANTPTSKTRKRRSQRGGKKTRRHRSRQNKTLYKYH